MSEEQGDGPSLVESVAHGFACHERWLQRAGYPERGAIRPVGKQCMFCRYYIPLVGVLAEDWGVCSNPASPFDGRVMFEHDGCEQFSPADEMWQARAEPLSEEEQARRDAEWVQLRIESERQRPGE